MNRHSARSKSRGSSLFSALSHALLSACSGRPRLPVRWTGGEGAGEARVESASERRGLPMALLVWALVWAMLVAPVLGQMHRAVHAAGGEGRASVTALNGLSSLAAWDSSDPADKQELAAYHAAGSFADCDDDGAGAARSLSGAQAHGGWIHALFAGHGPAECQLLDQLHHALAGPPAAIELPQALPAAHFALPATTAPRAIPSAAHFDARAPPALAARA